MDILVSSNLERMLYLLSGGNDKYIADLEDKLFTVGNFEVTDAIKAKLKDVFYAGYCDDKKTAETIARVYDEYGYLCDTHTAVAVAVAREYKAQTVDTRPMVIASTASPYKFAGSVFSAIGGTAPGNDFTAIDMLNEKTGIAVPAPIAALRNKKVRFSRIVKKTELTQAVFESLGI